MRKIVIFIISLFIGFEVCSAQKAEQIFPITGKPILTVFANYKAGLGNVNNIYPDLTLIVLLSGMKGILPKAFPLKL